MYFSGVSDLVARRGHGGQFLNFLAYLLSTVFERRYRKPSSRGSVTRPLEELAIELIGSSDETSGLVLAQLDGHKLLRNATAITFSDCGTRILMGHQGGKLSSVSVVVGGVGFEF